MAEQGRRFTSTGGRPSQKKPDQNGLWIAVIVLFCVGLWPFALGLMAYIWLSGDKNKRTEDKVQQARVKMDRTIDEALRRVSQAGAETDQSRAARSEPAGQPRVVQVQQTSQPAASDSAPRVRQKPKKSSSKSIDARIKKALGGDGSALRILGIVLIVLSTLILTEPIDDLIYLGSIYAVEDLIVGLNFLAGGGVLLGRGLYLRAFAKRCRKYITAIGKSDDMEIDLIARSREGILCFVEVKSRTSRRFSVPREAVTAAKQRRLRTTAAYYLAQTGQGECPCRFDVAEVYPVPEREPTINYIADAF